MNRWSGNARHHTQKAVGAIPRRYERARLLLEIVPGEHRVLYEVDLVVEHKVVLLRSNGDGFEQGRARFRTM